MEEDNEGEGQENGAIDAVPVDENLFTGEDLDELEEELNTLDLAEWHQTSNEKIEPTQQELKLTILIFFHLKLSTGCLFPMLILECLVPPKKEYSPYILFSDFGYIS